MSYLVLHVRPYDFDTKEGERRRGATVTYLDLSMQPDASIGELGHAPLQLSVERDVARQFREAPAYYELDFNQRRGPDGKPRLVLVGAEYIAGVPIGGSGEGVVSS